MSAKMSPLFLTREMRSLGNWELENYGGSVLLVGSALAAVKEKKDLERRVERGASGGRRKLQTFGWKVGGVRLGKGR
jgi:hypothetical protein